jgi:hypothetical protein
VTDNGESSYDKEKFGSRPGCFRNHFGRRFDCDDGAMSDYMEIINVRTMTCKLLKNGEMIAEYKVEQCDKCSQLKKLDSFGYQKGYDHTEKVIWFCGDCR